jgi:mannose-6-phosphate isomerase-like protein (cupin superfamily)
MQDNIKYDELESFLNWWMANRYINTPQDNSLTYEKDTHGVVLYRDGQFQVELFNVKPNSEIVPHIHPNVDSFEVFLGGDIHFMCDGVWSYEQKLGESITRVKPDSWHGGLFGERGGCFLSVQHWLNGVPPTFVGNDWKDKVNNNSYKES